VVAKLPAALDPAVADVRTAFPGLIRRLVEVNASERLALKLECEGVHEGPWRGIICPTGRYVLFEERHILAIRDGRVDTDFVAFDYGSILRQICVGNNVHQRHGCSVAG
jgi:predicted ester cyclase